MKKLRTMALLLLCLMVLATGCRMFAETENVIFVREDLTLDGKARVVVKIVRSVKTDVSYFDGEKWVTVPSVALPAGWLVVTPKLIKELRGE